MNAAHNTYKNVPGYLDTSAALCQGALAVAVAVPSIFKTQKMTHIQNFAIAVSLRAYTVNYPTPYNGPTDQSFYHIYLSSAPPTPPVIR